MSSRRLGTVHAVIPGGWQLLLSAIRIRRLGRRNFIGANCYSRMHCHTQCHQDNQEEGIQELLGVGGCNSWWQEIGEEALGVCTSLECNIIPNAFKKIDHTAFNNCTSLTSVKFCNKIKEFVSCKAMQGLVESGCTWKVFENVLLDSWSSNAAFQSCWALF